jgi:NAD(P)-dependent dehydrogenase (short-subunit alcohol dehydrogenase family)
MKRNVLITGTSTGVGFESALLFAQNGYKVYASMRSPEKAKAFAERIENEGLDIEIIKLDVTDVNTIKTSVEKIIEKDGKIDILVNNAGAGFAKTTEQASIQEIKWVTDVNYLGTVYCTQAVLPHMRTQQWGQIINVTSVGGLVGQPFNELYCGAKFAVEGYMEALATYIAEPFNIKISNVEPGGITTEFMNSAIANTAVEGQLASGEYLPIFDKYLGGIQKRAAESTTQTYQTGKEVAEMIIQIAQNENPPFRIRTSDWAEDFTKLKTEADPDGKKLINYVIEQYL